MINGEMREAQENRAYLQDLQPEDFERICEFAYRGDYAAPKPTEIEFSDSGKNSRCEFRLKNLSHTSSDTISDSSLPLYPSVLLSSPLRYSPLRTKFPSVILKAEKRKIGIVPELTEFFRERQYVKAGPPSIEISKGFMPINHVITDQDFEPVLLAYARIYAFAEQYIVNNLRDLTLGKLHSTLVSFPQNILCSDRDAIMGLVRFAYDNDYIPDRGTTIKIDALRELIVGFMVIHVGDMRFCSDHERFLAEEGRYARDLMAALHQWCL
jgi:hypothetical protein